MVLPCHWLIVPVLLATRIQYILSDDPYENQPKLITQDGHLIIMTAHSKNLTLQTSGQGYVNLNGENLQKIAQMARQASDVVGHFQANLKPSIQNRLNVLSQQMIGPRGLASKVATLEQAILNGNVSTRLAPGQRGPTVMRLNRITNRLRSVEAKVRSLQTLLTTDECLSSPCKNGGTCQDMFNRFMCICPSNWQGTYCDEDVNECGMYAGTDLGCQNGATCINKPGSYECACPDTYFGTHCTLRTNDCSSANSARLCGHGVCVNHGGNGRGFVCICDEGWTTDLAHSCTVDVDECQSKRYPCSAEPHVPCVNLPGSFHCGFCPPGYTGNGYQCTDLDECASNNGGCSTVPFVPCINTRGSRSCGSCPPGYMGDGATCSPVQGGACAINNGGCLPTALCLQTAGVVSCRCPPGQAGDGVTSCTPSSVALNPCHNGGPCRNGATCVNRGGVATCVCHPHTTGYDCGQPTYSGCQPNPCQNNATCSVDISTTGVYLTMCTCPPGFQGRLCESEVDACGGTFTQNTGLLDVPLGDSRNDQRCAWRIEVPDDKSVSVNITELSIHSYEQCDREYLSVEDPSGSMKKYCKPITQPVRFTASSNVVIIRLLTVAGRASKFKLNWEAVKPVCGGTISLSVNAHGSITSPQYPQNYPPNLDCTWLMHAPLGKRIQFHLNTLDLEAANDCSKAKDTLKIYNTNHRLRTDLLAVYCSSIASDSHIQVTTNWPIATLVFHSDASGSGGGFNIAYTTVDGCGGTLTENTGDISPPLSSDQTYRDEQDCEWRIQLPLGDRISLAFNSFDLEDKNYDGECDDFVEVRDGPSSSSPQVGRWCGSTLPPPFTSTSNTLTVKFKSDHLLNGNGFTIHYDTLCGGEVVGRQGEISSPNYPLPYHLRRNCIYVIRTPPATAIRLHFQDFELEDSYGECDWDFVEIRDGDRAESPLIGKYCNNEKPPDALSTHNFLYILFASDESENSFRGFNANYSTIDLPCGGILKDTTGVISSPLAEDGYPPDSACKWVVSAPPGWVVQIGFLTFHLEYSNECSADAVVLYDGPPETQYFIERYCGLKLPSPTTSSSNLVTLEFQTDDSVHREGFTAHYVMVDKRRVCGGTFRTISGHIESPNFPENYPDNKECTWIIHVPQGQQIKLTFESFDMEETRGCNYDSLIIRNGLYDTSPLVGKYCGQDSPPTVTSLTNGLWLHFSSDRSDPAKGFRATWDATATGCGGTLSSPSGSITSPNYPNPYARFAECFFRIATSLGSRVRITIVDLSLEQHSRCSLDYIEIFDGIDERSKSLGRYCSDNHPASIVSTANHVLIKFKSDISYSGRGFHLKYATECNVTLRGHYGRIESPGHPSNYPSHLNCVWLVQAPPGNKVNITFAHFSLEPASRWSTARAPEEKCRFDYLEISDGTKNQTNHNKLGKWCGEESPPTISSNYEQVYVHFVTDLNNEQSGFSLEWVVSGCGGIYRNRPHGMFSSPNYPQSYPVGIECEWSFIAPSQQSIEFTIHDLQVESMGHCDFDYLAIYGGEDESSPLLLHACHQDKFMVVTTSGNKAFVKFKSDFSYTSKGFTAGWRYVDSKCGGRFEAPFGLIHSHNYPQNYDNKDDCEWVIEVPTNHVVNLTFTDFDVEEPLNDNTTTDYVNVYDGDSTSAALLLSHSGNVLPDPPYVLSTSNTILVRHKADGSLTAKGFSAKYTMACGARIIAKGSGILELEDTVSAASLWSSDDPVNCTWHIIADDPADKIYLMFSRMELSPSEENTKDSCSYNYLSVHDGDDTGAPIVLQTCGTKVPPALVSSGSAFTIHVVGLSSYRSFLGRFTAMYSTYATACGGELTSLEGIIASPGYPNGYPSKADCVWELKASPGNNVTLTFIKFDLEDNENCNTDYVEVRSDSDQGALQGVFCGSQLPDNITAAHTIWIRFRSDETGTAKGFSAEYSLVHGNELTGDSGQIASPLYPLGFLHEGTFKWTITVAPDKVVRIVFADFYTDSFDPTYCSVFVKIFDGLETDGTAPQLLEACGATVPAPVITTGNTASILFSNDGSWNRGSTFLLVWQAELAESAVKAGTNQSLGCGQALYLNSSGGNDSVTFNSPGFPHNYAANLKCDWIVTTDPGFHVELRFTDLDFDEFDVVCLTDFVTVFTQSKTGAAGDWSPLSASNLCLHNTTKMIFRGEQKLKVHFETDTDAGNRTIDRRGFSAKASVVCGGTLSDPSGVIDTTGLQPNETTGRVSCEWEMVVRSGRVIQLTFSSFNLPKLGMATCENSYIMLRNGGYKDSPPWGEGKYCGRDKPEIVQSSSNRAYIQYNAMARAPGLVMRYQEIPPFSCDYRFTLTEGEELTITSPNYPQVPPAHTTCTWSVTSTPGTTIHIDFVDRFDMKRSPGCQLEYVEVKDGGTELAPTLGDRTCFLAHPSPKISTGNRMFIKYFTDAETPNNGFKAIVKIGYCGGVHHDVYRSLVISSPHYPHSYPQNVNCQWTVIAYMPNYQISYNVTDLSLPGDESSNCTDAKDYVEFVNVDPITKNETGTPFRICGEKSNTANGSALVPPSISGMVYIRFHSNSTTSGSHRRFSIKITVSGKRCNHELTSPSGVFTSPGYPTSAPHIRFTHCTWLIRVPEGRRVTLKIVDFDLRPMVNLPFNLKFVLYDKYFRRVDVFRDNIINAGMTFDTFDNVLKVVYFDYPNVGNYRGFKVEFSSDKIIECGGVLGEKGMKLYNATGQPVYFCEWTHSRDPTASNQTTFTVTINGTLNGNMTGPCPTNYFINGENIIVTTAKENRASDQELLQLCESTKSPITVRNPFPHTAIRAQKLLPPMLKGSPIPASLATGAFSLSYKTDACGGLVSGSEAVITSPGYPAPYGSGIDCAWAVTFQDRILVSFDDMDLDGDCQKNFVTIYNGPMPSSPHLVNAVCGNAKMADVRSQSSSLFIEFHSAPDGNTANNRKGFKLSLREDRTACGGTIYEASGEIESPNYGVSDYPNNTECEWTVMLPGGVHASINFIGRFSIETSRDCANDYVKIFDWKNDDWEQIDGNLCGRVAPTKLTTTGNKFRVLFRSNDVVTSDGFMLSWEKECGGTFNVKGVGTISSPNYPKPYFNGLNCTYKLIANGNKIFGTFEDFSVEESVGDGERCQFDSVTVTTQSVALAHMRFMGSEKTVLCGSIKPDNFTSRGEMTINLKTDSYTGHKGFLFKYYIESCGRNITTPSPILSSDSIYTNERNNCTWYVTAPQDQVVVLRFKTIFSMRGGACDKFGLEIFEGHDVTNKSSLQATTCSNQNKKRFISYGNKMAINYFRSNFQRMFFRGDVSFSYGVKQKCGGTVLTADERMPYVLRSPDVNGDKKYEPFLFCDWLVLAPDGERIRINIDKLDLQNCTSCNCDVLEMRDGDSESHELIVRTCGAKEALADSIMVSSTGSLFIHFMTDGSQEFSGFQLTITTIKSECGAMVRNATKEVQVLRSPPLSSGAHRCLWQVAAQRAPNSRQPTPLALRLTRLDLPPPCSRNYLEIKKGHASSDNEWLWGERLGSPVKFCGNRTMDLSMSSGYATVRLVTTEPSSHVGFTLEYKTSGCSNNYTSRFGSITSMTHEFLTRNDETNCINLIQLDQANLTISLYFNTFMCFQSRDGKLTIYDGTSDQAEEIMSVCTPLNPNPVFSKGPSLLMKFQHFDYYGSFDITYTTTDQGRGCGGHLRGPYGIFTSPLYPATYKDDSACRWDVTVPHGLKIHFNFKNFDLGPSSSCNRNYIAFYDVDAISGAEVLRSQFCGNEKPATIQMAGDTAFVRYVSSVHNNGTGWVLRWFIPSFEHGRHTYLAP